MFSFHAIFPVKFYAAEVFFSIFISFQHQLQCGNYAIPPIFTLSDEVLDINFSAGLVDAALLVRKRYT